MIQRREKGASELNRAGEKRTDRTERKQVDRVNIIEIQKTTTMME